MKWPRRKKKVQVDLHKSEAAIAAREAGVRLSETQSHWPEVKALTARLEYIRKRNHLAEAIEEAILGGRDT